MRHLKIFFLSMAVFGLMVGSAVAGPVQANHAGVNGEFTISAEVMGIARDIVLDRTSGGSLVPSGATNAAVTYIPGQPVTIGSLLAVTITGGAFNGSAVTLCAVNGTVGATAGNNPLPIHITTATPAANLHTYNFNAANAAPAGSVIYFTSAVNATAGEAGGCRSQGGGAFNNPQQLYLRATSPSGSIPISVGLLTSGGISLDPAGSANYARVRSEYATNISAVNHTVDYLGLLGDGTRLIPGVVAFAGSNGADTGGAVNIARRVNNLCVNGAAGDNAGLTASVAVSLTDTANWQGLTKVFLINGNNPGTCTDAAATNLVGTGALNGTLSFTIPTGAFNGQVGWFGSVCLVGAGTQTLTIPRTINASSAITVSGSGAVSPAVTPSTTIDSWDTNAYQGFVTWLVNSSVLPTFCLIANNDLARTATLRVEVVTSESAVVATGTLGTLAPKTSVLATFQSNSASIAGGTAVDLTTLGADKRYVARITSTTNPNNTTVTCIQTDPATGVKRAVPVLTNSPWRQ